MVKAKNLRRPAGNALEELHEVGRLTEAESQSNFLHGVIAHDQVPLRFQGQIPIDQFLRAESADLMAGA